jgi:calcium-dependent protein kinase
VLNSTYDEKCDVWSCGVILFILLAGEPPFSGENNEEILDNVETGQYNIDQYDHISKDAKNLVKLMMEFDPKKRITAQQALENIWIKNQAPNSFTVNLAHTKVLENLKNFKADQKLLEATIAFIVNQLTTKNEISELRKIFLELDANNDGRLSFEEIVEGYKKMYGSLNPEEDAKAIFEKVDSDENGYIGYEGKII